MLAVELLQREARLMQHGDPKGVRKGSLRVVPLFETVADLKSAGAVMRRLLSVDWYLQHVVENHDSHQEVRGSPTPFLEAQCPLPKSSCSETHYDS